MKMSAVLLHASRHRDAKIIESAVGGAKVFLVNGADQRSRQARAPRDGAVLAGSISPRLKEPFIRHCRGKKRWAKSWPRLADARGAKPRSSFRCDPLIPPAAGTGLIGMWKAFERKLSGSVDSVPKRTAWVVVAGRHLSPRCPRVV